MSLARQDRTSDDDGHDGHYDGQDDVNDGQDDDEDEDLVLLGHLGNNDVAFKCAIKPTDNQPLINQLAINATDPVPIKAIIWQ